MASTFTEGNSNIFSMCFAMYPSIRKYFPRLFTSLYSILSFSAISSTSSPSLPDINSPLWLSNLSAFHCFGLWLAVKTIPPSAFSSATAISTVGVVLNPRSITSTPTPIKEPATRWFTISPEIRASRPTTIFTDFFSLFCLIQIAKAELNFTISIGLNPSPDLPPIVPLIPEIDLINVTVICFLQVCKNKLLN